MDYHPFGILLVVSRGKKRIGVIDCESLAYAKFLYERIRQRAGLRACIGPGSMRELFI